MQRFATLGEGVASVAFLAEDIDLATVMRTAVWLLHVGVFHSLSRQCNGCNYNNGGMFPLLYIRLEGVSFAVILQNIYKICNIRRQNDL